MYDSDSGEALRLTKHHGTGNDFLVLLTALDPPVLSPDQNPGTVRPASRDRRRRADHRAARA